MATGGQMDVNWPADRVERRPVAGLVPYARNARTHSPEQIGQLVASIREWGWTMPILVDEQGGIIAGHGRVMAAQQMGLVDVPVMVAVGWTEAQRRAYVLADNKLALNAGWDDALLSLEAADLAGMGFDMGLTGFSAAELTSLAPVDASTSEDVGSDADPDEQPDPPRVVVTRPGDVWLLGKHRLLCGDSTDYRCVDRVMAGDQAALLFTSPPYGNQRDYTTGGVSDWDALMQGVFKHLDTAMRPDGQVLVNLGLIHRDSEWQPYWSGWVEWMRTTGWRRFGLYTWDQGPGLPGDWNGRLSPSFEFVFHFNRTPRRPNKIIPCTWAGQVKPEHGGLRAKDGTVGEWQHAGKGVQETRIPDNVLRISRHKARGIETEHPAVFPVALPEFLLRSYTDEGEIVVEPFSGSGTTLIAAQRTGRRVRAIEFAPAYVDLAIARWRSLFPEQPVTHAEDGRTYDAVAAERLEANENAA